MKFMQKAEKKKIQQQMELLDEIEKDIKIINGDEEEREEEEEEEEEEEKGRRTFVSKENKSKRLEVDNFKEEQEENILNSTKIDEEIKVGRETPLEKKVMVINKTNNVVKSKKRINPWLEKEEFEKVHKSQKKQKHNEESEILIDDTLSGVVSVENHLKNKDQEEYIEKVKKEAFLSGKT
jgi:hypothetical protein